MKRRLFLKNLALGSFMVPLLGAGVLFSNRAFAKSVDFKALSNDMSTKITNATVGLFKFKVADIAENGAFVAMTVDASAVEKVTNISFYIHNNHIPLAASFNLLDASAYASVRVKMVESSVVTALVTADGALTAISKEVKVIIGGCGG